MLEIVQAHYVGERKIHVIFNSGESGIVDLTHSLWGPMFEGLRSPERFRQFKLSPELHTIAWDNEADFAPEYLREKMIEQTPASDGQTAARIAGREE